MDQTIVLEILAFLGGLLGITSSAPQFYRILMLKCAASVSLATYVMLLFSSILWVGYGLMEPCYAIVFWNSIGIVLTSMVIVAKYRYRPAPVVIDEPQ